MKNEIYFKKLNLGFIQRLRHNEFGQLIHNIIEIPSNDEIEEPELIDAYYEIKSKSDKLSDVRIYSRKHELSDVLIKDASKRREHLSSLMMSIQAEGISVSPERRSAASVLYLWVRPVRRLFSYPGIELQSRLVKDLHSARLHNDLIDSSLELLGLDEHFEYILNETSTIEENFRKRNNDLAAMTLNVKELRKEIYIALQTFVSYVEFSVNRHKNDSHISHRWFRELEELLDYYQRRLKSRVTTRNKSSDDLGSGGAASSTGPDTDTDTDIDIPIGNEVGDCHNVDESDD